MAQITNWLKLTAEEQAIVDRNTRVETVSCSEEKFTSQLPAYLERFKPDILWLNPYSAFAPPIMDQGKTSKFLREGITPILRKYNCDLIAPHHTPKTQNRDTSEWSYIDWSYSCAGWAV